jgi:hypothetical protein
LKFAIPLAAIFCFGALAPLAPAADSGSKKRSSSSAKKKNSTSKKSSKSAKSSKSSQSRKSKSDRTSKKKNKTERSVAKSETSNSWIDELPEVALPELSGPPEDELLEPVGDAEAESDDSDSDPQP